MKSNRHVINMIENFFLLYAFIKGYAENPFLSHKDLILFWTWLLKMLKHIVIFRYPYAIWNKQPPRQVTRPRGKSVTERSITLI